MPKINNGYIKNEASYSLNDRNFGDYIGVGMKASLEKLGNLDGMFAYKFNKESQGVFGELKYTSPEITSNTSIELRNRIQLESSGNTYAVRMAEKYSKDIGKFNVYEIVGATTKISLDGDGIKSINPVILIGAGYKISNHISCYAEGELSRGYDVKRNEWKDLAPSIYAGLKYTF